MNYTAWIKETCPVLENASSAETYQLISRAKQKTQSYRIVNTVAVVIMATLAIEYISEALELNANRWMQYLVALPFIIVISDVNERLIVKNQIKKSLLVT
jgi:vacuolar-type H+-ATPase subunit F/Vma7